MTTVRTAFIIALLAATAALLSLGFSPRAATPPKAFEWASRSVQVEVQAPDGRWVARDPLALSHGMDVLGHGVGEPDVRLTLVAVPDPDQGIVTLQRRLNITCQDGQTLGTTFDDRTAQQPWKAQLRSTCGTWRFTLVDTATARNERVAAPGEFPLLPAAHGSRT